MITLEEISKKISAVLNGIDEDIDESSRNKSFMGYEYVVLTEGFHLDYVYDMESGKNFIPVFVGALGGEYNPIVGLEEANYSVQIAVYFPARLKKDFYALNEYLYNYFVGKIHNYGSDSAFQQARSNISVAQYGEIQGLDTQQFVSWVENTYKMPRVVMENWFSMSFNLYLTTVANLGNSNGFMFGESLSIKSLKYNGYELENVTYMAHTSNLSSEPYSEQLLGSPLHKTIISGSSQVFEIPFYLRKTNNYKELFEDYINGTISNKEVEITINFLGTDYVRKCIVQNASIHAQLGEILGISLTMSLKVD